VAKEAGVAQSVKHLGYVLCQPGFEPRRGPEFFLLYKMSRSDMGPTHPPVECAPGAVSPGGGGGQIGWGVRLTTHFHLVPRAIMNGAVPPFFLHAFVACIETNLLLIGDYEERACFVKGFMAMFNLLHRIVLECTVRYI
jgi:hypothetical protein